jgi:hypothetical protein
MRSDEDKSSEEGGWIQRLEKQGRDTPQLEANRIGSLQ